LERSKNIKIEIMKKSIFAFLLFLNSCVGAQDNSIIEDKNVVIRQVANFNEIQVRGPFTVHFSDGKNCDLAVSASEKSVRDMIVTNVVSGQLQISLGEKSWRGWQSNLKLKVYISAPDIKKITASGASDFIVHDILKSSNLDLVFSGASDFKGKIDAQLLTANFSGASDLTISGSVRDAKIKVSGASDFKGFSLNADNVEATSSGASSIKITAHKSIKAVASGASDIEYKGNPSSISKSSSGASSIVKKD
jgi:hypothetical protein